MSITCANVNVSENQNNDIIIKNLIWNRPYFSKEVLKFSVGNRNYLFYIGAEYDYEINDYRIRAHLIDETSCFEGNCQEIAYIDLSNLNNEILLIIRPKVCQPDRDDPTLRIGNSMEDAIHSLKIEKIYEVSNNEMFVVASFPQNIAVDGTSTGGTFSIKTFDVYLIFKVSPSSLSLERIELPIVNFVPSDSCISPTYLQEASILNFEDENTLRFIVTRIFIEPDSEVGSLSYLIYSVNLQNSQTSILNRQQMTFF